MTKSVLEWFFFDNFRHPQSVLAAGTRRGYKRSVTHTEGNRPDWHPMPSAIGNSPWRQQLPAPKAPDRRRRFSWIIKTRGNRIFCGVGRLLSVSFLGGWFGFSRYAAGKWENVATAMDKEERKALLHINEIKVWG